MKWDLRATLNGAMTTERLKEILASGGLAILKAPRRDDQNKPHAEDKSEHIAVGTARPDRS